MIQLRPARFPHDLDTVRALFHEYADALGLDLGFQGFDAELASLPGKYAPPAGRLLIAWRDATPLGCIAMRRIADTDVEMKRLYVRPLARGAKLGRLLVERLCLEAREAGYARMCLDTLSTLEAALALYRSVGFEPIDPYVFNPLPGATFLALDLRRPVVSLRQGD